MSRHYKQYLYSETNQVLGQTSYGAHNNELLVPQYKYINGLIALKMEAVSTCETQINTYQNNMGSASQKTAARVLDSFKNRMTSL